MARGRGKRNVAATSAGRRATSLHISNRRQAQTRRALTPGDVYDDLLAEAAVVDPVEESSRRPIKRRKVTQDQRPNRKDDADGDHANDSTRSPVRHAVNDPPIHRPKQARISRQTLELSSDSDESDFGFEDVDLEIASAPVHDPSDDEGIHDVTVAVGPSSTTKIKTTPSRRKPLSALEKSRRILAHKAHVVSLLGHCMIANSRCNDVKAHRALRTVIDKQTRTFLNPREDFTQFQQNYAFMDGLERASTTFKAAFTVTESSVWRSRWSDGDLSSLEQETQSIDRQDFINAATSLCGSQDTGNQLFCAMLRAVGIDARLVCSLQVLPIANPTSKPKAPQQSPRPVVFAIAPDTSPTSSQIGNRGNASQMPLSSAAAPAIRRRLGQPEFSPIVVSKTLPQEKRKPLTRLAYPIFWVEAFNSAYQKWITLDPTVTGLIDKPSRIEPPGSYDSNNLVYAIAFEANGVAKDVTRRYAKAFNAKTRRLRLDGNGEENARWLAQTLRLFRPRSKLHRDEIEDMELNRREGREGLPSNVQDFKGHPVYALERHLRRHEVIYPKREVGKLNTGTAAKPKMEVVFRRQDVHGCRSADRWFRVGREVIHGEQPLKRVPARARQRTISDDDEEEERGGESAMTPLYAFHQTRLYAPQPVASGRVPRNAYGNLDIYVPSMVPSGGSHISHLLTREAAKLLRVDAVDAVTGFKFSGRKGTAVIEGAVVPTPFAEAVKAVIEGLEFQVIEDECRRRSLLAMRVWARFLKGLQIAERVASYADRNVEQPQEVATGNDEEHIIVTAAVDDDDEEPLTTSGQYTLEQLIRATKPQRKSQKRAVRSETEDETYDFEIDGNEPNATIVPSPADDLATDAFDSGGGFLPEDTVSHQIRSDTLSRDQSDGLLGGGGFFHGSESPGHHEGGFIVPDEDAEDSGSASHHSKDIDVRASRFPDDGDYIQDDTHASEDEERHPSQVSQLDDQSPHREMAPKTDPVLARSDENEGYKSGSDLAEEIYDQMDGSDSPETDHIAANDGLEEGDSVFSHDPEDEDAEPDWMESE